MKYFVMLCDGMADEPYEKLGGKTPMMLAKKPNMDALASKGEVGLVKTVQDGMKGNRACKPSACLQEIRRFWRRSLLSLLRTTTCR